jgi:hypothetical protein
MRSPDEDVQCLGIHSARSVPLGTPALQFSLRPLFFFWASCTRGRAALRRRATLFACASRVSQRTARASSPTRANPCLPSVGRCPLFSGRTKRKRWCRCASCTVDTDTVLNISLDARHPPSARRSAHAISQEIKRLDRERTPHTPPAVSTPAALLAAIFPRPFVVHARHTHVRQRTGLEDAGAHHTSV